jgi:glycosyltransferase involved in cell wall biosynthesis
MISEMIMQKAYQDSTEPVLAIVVPCFNEEAILPSSAVALENLLRAMMDDGTVSRQSFILFVDDGSTDATWQIISSLHQRESFLRGLKLAGNAGHQNALLAGMFAVKDRIDCLVSLDVDLQDDISVIPEMLAGYKAGAHIVYGVRRDRSTDNRFKRVSAKLFYALMRVLGAPIIPHHADFRLISRLVLQTLSGYPERMLFLRSVFPAMKVRAASVYYARAPRQAGESKYPFWKMLSFALLGITTNSSMPLRLAAILGAAGFLTALPLSIIALGSYLAGAVISGWTSMFLTILYLGSTQLICLALLGEYVAKIFVEVKHRPRYIIEEELD